MTDAKIMDRIDEWREKNPLRAFKRESRMKMSDIAMLLGRGERATQYLMDGNTRKLSADLLSAMARLLGKRESEVSEQWQKWVDQRPQFLRRTPSAAPRSGRRPR